MWGLPPSGGAVVSGLVLGAIGLGIIVALVRLIGLRSFSKMTAFDFIITLATGSLLATAATATRWPDFLQALVAIAVLMSLQVVLALARRSVRGVERLIENQPLILMRDGAFIDGAMSASRVSRDDVMAKLRAANVLELSQVRAVVLETTGDISVLHGDHLAEEILTGVRTR